MFKVKVALFDTISGNSNIDHPLCDECADNLIELLEQQLKITQEDYDDYSNYYKTYVKNVTLTMFVLTFMFSF